MLQKNLLLQPLESSTKSKFESFAMDERRG